MESVEELVAKLKGDVFNWACEMAQSRAKVLLEKIDEELVKEREEGLMVEVLKEHWVTTLFGDVKIRRRLDRDSEGNYCSFWMRR